MHVNLPFAYTATFAKPGKPPSAPKVLVDWVERDVPEIGSASVARFAFWNVCGLDGIRYRTQAISWKGETYVELRADGDEKIRLLPGDRGYLVKEHGVIASVMGLAMLSEREYEAMAHAIVRPRPHETAKLPEIISSNLELNRRTAEDCVSSLIHFEGAFWKKVPRICLELRTVPGGYILEIFTSRTGFAGRDKKNSYDILLGPAQSRYYPLDEIERATAHAGVKLHGVRFSHLEFGAKPPTFDAERDYLSRCLDYAVSKTSRELGEMGRESTSDWLYMRDILETCAKDGSDFPDDIHDVLKRFAPTVKDDRVRSNLMEACSHLENFEADRATPHPVSKNYNRYSNRR